VVLTNILTMNVLIAMLSKTYIKNVERSDATWTLDIMGRVIQYERQFPELLARAHRPTRPSYNFSSLLEDMGLIVYCIPEVHTLARLFGLVASGGARAGTLVHLPSRRACHATSCVLRGTNASSVLRGSTLPPSCQAWESHGAVEQGGGRGTDCCEGNKRSFRWKGSFHRVGNRSPRQRERGRALIVARAGSFHGVAAVPRLPRSVALATVHWSH
jgi:hypothetical protein